MKTYRGLKFAVIVVLLLCGMSLTSTVLAQGTWFDSDWDHRCSVTVNNPAGSALTNYQVLVTLDGGDPESDFYFNFSHAAAGGADVRITANDGTTLLPFWIETWDAVGETARIWVRVDNLPAGNNTLYVYYGNPEAESASDGASTFIFFDGFDQLMNADDYLTTPAAHYLDQVVHPDVIYVPGRWNGYEYWMAVTPYPDNQDQYENPSILASRDGLTWEEPPGITNPLVPAPVGGHNSDPDLLLVDNTLMLYYVELTGEVPGADFSNVNLLTSTNGINWNGPTTVISVPLANNDYVLSPAVLYEEEGNGTFYMWYIRGACGLGTSSVYLRTSTDGLTWGPEQGVSLSHTGHVVWHTDVQWDGSKYTMLYAAYPDNLNCTSTDLYYAESTNFVNWTANTTPVLTPSPSGWDSTDIYRSTFLADDDFLRIWYSAQSYNNVDEAYEWHVGYTEGDLSDFIAAQTQPWDTIQNDTGVWKEHARSGSYGLRQVGSSDGGDPYPRVTEAIAGHISFSAWVYDDMSTESNYLAVLRVWGPANTPIGVGIFTGQSTDFYAYHNASYEYATSGRARSEGWHRLTINVGATTSYLLIDGTQIASLDVLDEENITGISLEGYTDGVGYFDDAYVRQFVDSEPSTTDIGNEENSPTAVTLGAFTAQPEDGLIIVSWETASELDNVGFNLYRSDAVDGPYVLLNKTLIPSQVPGSVLGAIYTWRDEDVLPGRTYFYYLEDLEIGGVRGLHGPVSAMLSANPNAVHLQQSPTGLGVTSVSVLGLFLVIGGVLFGRRRRRNL